MTRYLKSSIMQVNKFFEIKHLNSKKMKTMYLLNSNDASVLAWVLIISYMIIMAITGTLYNIWRNGREHYFILKRIFLNPFFWLTFSEAYFFKYYIFRGIFGINNGILYESLIPLVILFMLIIGAIIQLKFFRRTTLFIIHE